MWIDSHCHWQDPAFISDLYETLARARQAGVWHSILPGTTRSDWARVFQLCAQYPADFSAACGLHPWFIQKHKEADLSILEKLAQTQKIIAIGECGLDFFDTTLSFAEQEKFFIAQLRIAKTYDLPLIIHARRALDTVIARLRRFAPLRGVVHSFAGSLQQAEQVIRMGFLLGIGGTVTYPRAQKLRKVVQTVPAHALLLETDAPYQPLCGRQGVRNEAAFLVDSARIVAELRGITLKHLAEQTTNNARTLFRISPNRLPALPMAECDFQSSVLRPPDPSHP